ncbi:MAG: hypothetical protein PHD05_00650 [Sphaerochaetaceae bacterium]|jgi:Holliday junction resolvase RusA-like endonuclease|nr:hypothetical protein [Sphaerochaetaceae bacterium]
MNSYKFDTIFEEVDYGKLTSAAAKIAAAAAAGIIATRMLKNKRLKDKYGLSNKNAKPDLDTLTGAVLDAIDTASMKSVRRG